MSTEQYLAEVMERSNAASVNRDVAHISAVDVPRLTAAVGAVLQLHYAADNDADRTPACQECHGKTGVHSCGCWAPEDRERVCGHCNEGRKGARVPYPCPTVRAIEEAL